MNPNPRTSLRLVLAVLATLSLGTSNAAAASAADTDQDQTPTATTDRTLVVQYKTIQVRGVDVFYREAGPKDAPVVLLLHGFPTSSQMFRGLIPALAQKYRVLAPDYPGFGQSAMPPRSEFAYTFDNLAATIESFTNELQLSRYALYVQDYGAPVGFRLAAKHPEKVSAIIVQNGNAYDEGLDNDFWKPIKKYWAEPSSENRDALRGLLTYEATKWQYSHGVPNPSRLSPDGPAEDQFLLDREGNKEIQLDLFLSYGSNPALYPAWQQYFRDEQPPVLVLWGKNDEIFPAAGAEPYKRDLKHLEFHLLDAGHFALETDGPEMAATIEHFLDRQRKSR